MKLFKYSDYINESKLELLLEANMIFSKDFLATVADVQNPIAEKILKLYKTDVDVDTNYIDISDKENFVEFKSDRRVETACIIVNPGVIYGTLSARLFQSFATIYNEDDAPFGENFRDYIDVDQPARIVKKLTSDDDRLTTGLKATIERGASLYHIKWNFGDKNTEYDAIIGSDGIRKGERAVKPQEVRVGSLIQSLLKKSGQEVNPSELEDFVIKFNNAVKSKKENLFKDFQIVKREDIREYYLEDNYESSNHTLGASCMRYEKCQKYLDIYVKNPNQVSMVVLFSEKYPEKIRGRALLWTDIKYKDLPDYDGKPFMDRIYVNNSKDEELFKEFAKKNGFVYKRNQDFSKYGFLFNGEDAKITRLDVRLEYNSFEYYPYIDTLANYTPWNSNLNNIHGEYTLNETDGTNGESEGCETCDGEEYIDCSRCGGHGEVTCWKCDGDGEYSCETCSGAGEENCSMCDGSGEDGDGKECENCSGTGEVSCMDCEGNGLVSCSKCDGVGDIECPECEGNGRETCPDCQ